MAQLSVEEKIKRIEQAPVEMQTMVAKAFLREDIDDEDVQYLFNTDTIEELNDPEVESNVENINFEEPEGIGAGDFFIRGSKPGAGNKNFITTGSGGWNTCIKGYPRDKDCDCLANCVGYASGRFNEIINEALEKTGCSYKTLNCNAENFIERAKAAGLKTGSTPRVGAIGVAQKGATLSGNDGAGHVWIVERVNSKTNTYTGESGYGSKAFWNQTRDNSNGRWGLSSSYKFRAFIYLPDDAQKVVDSIVNPQPTPTPQPEPTPAPQPGPVGKFNIGDKVVINGALYESSNAASPTGNVVNRVTNITRRADGSAHPYNTTGDLGWMDESSITKYVEPTPVPTPTPEPVKDELKIGDKVKIIGTGNGSSYGKSNTAYGIGWTRQILNIWYEDKEKKVLRPYPYQVGNSTGTTGFYTKDALKKI